MQGRRRSITSTGCRTPSCSSSSTRSEMSRHSATAASSPAASTASSLRSTTLSPTTTPLPLPPPPPPPPPLTRRNPLSPTSSASSSTASSSPSGPSASSLDQSPNLSLDDVHAVAVPGSDGAIVSHHSPTEVLKNFNEIQTLRIEQPFVLKACSDLGNLQSLMGIHCQIFKSGFHSDVFALNSLVHAYSLCGCVDFARAVFDELPERDLISWTVVIGSYIRSNRPKEAIDLFFLMREENVKPDEVVVVYLFNGCSQLGDLNFGRSLEGLVRETGVDYNPYVLNSLIDMYAKCGSIGDARKVFDQMSKRTIVSWNSMVAGYARCGNMESTKRLFDCIPLKNNMSRSTLLNGFVQNGAFKEALMVFREMQVKCVTPNDASIRGVITACSHLGAPESEGRISLMV